MKRLFIVVPLLVLSFNYSAEEIDTPGKGVVDFHAEPLPGHEGKSQPVNWYGCNPKSDEVVNVDWGGTTKATFPYGEKVDGEKAFFAARYYLASPPVPPQPKPGEKTTIGLLKPDKFVFTTTPPEQKVVLDYTVLTPVYLQFVDIDYGTCNGVVNTIPVNTVCPYFPHVEGDLRPASGIGVLENKDGASKIFLPSIDAKGESPLQCDATILNDIQLHYKIRFKVGKSQTETLDLTNHFVKNPKKSVELMCEKREPVVSALPLGCSKPRIPTK